MRPAAVRLSVLALASFAACGGRTQLQKEALWRTPQAGAVVSEHPLATKVGLDILDRGGNAADAAVATALALAVVARTFDFRETAPAAANAERFFGGDGKLVEARSLVGPLSVAVPGSPRGLWELWHTCGSRLLRFDELVQPALDLARQGFEVDAWLAAELAKPETRAKMNAAALKVFYPGGEPLHERDILRQPDLATTLSLLSGPEPMQAFYTGRTAEKIVVELAATPVPGAPGEPPEMSSAPWLTLADLAAYKVQSRPPLRGWFRGMEILTMAPPSSGGIVLLQALGILEGLPLDAQKARAAANRAIEREKGVAAGVDSPNLDERMVHWWIEAMRCAFADRAEHMGDPDFIYVPVRELLSADWIARRRVSIGPNAAASVSAWQPPHEGTETTHVSVLDRAGNAVSLTTTINSFFGSGILVGGAGFFLNDEIDDFALAPGRPNQFGLVGGAANAIAPGKRPLSSMAPTVVRDGGHATVIVLGSPGGPRIITAILEVLLRVLVLEQTMPEAVAAPRLHQQWSPSETTFEDTFDPVIVDELKNRRGHQVHPLHERYGSVQAIWLPEVGGLPIAVSDPRRGGTAGVQGQAPSTPARP